jgi:plasmid stabilization system protein ParE
MVRKIIWSEKAQTFRREILEYWFHRTKSRQYSKKLNSLFRDAIKLIKIYPELGKPTSAPNIRFKIVYDYLMFYEENPTQIMILSIWDSRRNPEKLKLYSPK